MSLNTILATAPLTTTNYVLKATGTTIGNSLIWDNGTNVGIGNQGTTYTLDVSGTGRFTGTLTGAAGTFAGNLSVTGNNLFTLAATNVSARIGEYDAANRICLTANQNGANAQDDATKPSWGLVFNANVTNTAFIGYKAAGGGSAALTSLMTIAGTGGINIPVSLNNSNTGLDLTNNAGSGYGNSLNYYTSTTKFGSIQVESSATNTSEMSFKTMVGSTLATRLFISSAGNVGIGTSSPSYKLDVVSLGSPSARVRNGDLGGTATLLLETANNFSGTCQTYIQCIGSTGTGLSNLAFGTAGASGDSTATERMRITSGGTSTVLLGKTTSLYATALRASLEINGVDTSILALTRTNDATATFYIYYAADNNIYFQNNKAGGGIYIQSGNSGGVQLTAGSTAFAPQSDERLKNIQGNIENAIDKLSTLRTVIYSWKSDDENKENLGLIAQDVQKVFPQVIEKSIIKEDPINGINDDTTQYLSLKYTDLIPVLVKAIQEQQAQIEELSNRLIKLENK